MARPQARKAEGIEASMRGAGRRLAAPETFDAKGDNAAAVLFVNHVDGGRFREIDQIGGC